MQFLVFQTFCCQRKGRLAIEEEAGSALRRL